MGYKVRKELQEAPINLSYQEAMKYSKIFKGLDSDRDGHISLQDLKKALTEMGETVSDDDVLALIAEVDINKNRTIEEEEFLQVHLCTCIHVCVCITNTELVSKISCDVYLPLPPPPGTDYQGIHILGVDDI